VLEPVGAPLAVPVPAPELPCPVLAPELLAPDVPPDPEIDPEAPVPAPLPVPGLPAVAPEALPGGEVPEHPTPKKRPRVRSDATGRCMGPSGNLGRLELRRQSGQSPVVHAAGAAGQANVVPLMQLLGNPSSGLFLLSRLSARSTQVGVGEQGYVGSMVVLSSL